MRRLTKTHQAEADLIDIWLFIYKAWGEAQADRYLDELEVRMERLTRNPRMGKSRELLRPGYRSWPVGRHIVFYRIDEAEVTVVRVLHEKMDPEIQFNPDPN
jgi:toxin ParE1/3/4